MTQPPDGNEPTPQGGHVPPPPPPPPPGGGPVWQGGPPAGPTYPAGAYSTTSPYASPGAPPQPTQKRALAVTSFVLGLLGCIPFASIAAVIVGIVALVKRQSRPLAITGIILGLLWTLGGIAFYVSGAASRIVESVEDAARTSTETGSGAQVIDSFDLSTGDCFNDAAASAAGSEEVFESGELELLDCGEPHAFEVYEMRDMADGAFPGEDVVLAEVQTVCLDSFEEFIGLPYDDSVIEVTYYYPSAESWSAGDDRTIICAVTEGESTVGSLQGVNR